MYKILLFIGLLIFMSCTSNTTDAKAPVSEVIEETTQEVAEITEELTIDELMQQIDAETGALTPEESKTIVQDIHACSIKDYKGIKKHIFCFDGGMRVHEGIFYYVEGKPIAARYILKRYNASPANEAEYDEAKTMVKQAILHFKDGDLNVFDKVLNEHNEVVVLDKEQTEEWEILIAAIQ